MVAPNYRSLWLSYYSKKQIKVDYNIYFVCKVSKVKVILHLSVSGKPVAELTAVCNNLYTIPMIPVLPQHPYSIIYQCYLTDHPI